MQSADTFSWGRLIIWPAVGVVPAVLGHSLLVWPFTEIGREIGIFGILISCVIYILVGVPIAWLAVPVLGIPTYLGVRAFVRPNTAILTTFGAAYGYIGSILLHGGDASINLQAQQLILCGAIVAFIASRQTGSRGAPA